jgi:hypothetical protein
VPGRSGTAYANAIRDELPEGTTVLDAFHVVKLGSAMVDEVPPPLQQDTLGHGGRKADPLYGIRRTCRSELNTSLISNSPRLDAKLAAGDPTTKLPLPAGLSEAPQHLPRPVEAGQGTRQRRAHNDGPCRPGGGQALFQVSNA